MPTVFISHSNQDSALTLRLVQRLKRAGYGVWVDFENIRGGADWLCEIQAGIQRCDAIIVLLTKAALKSRWVERECLYAFQLRKPVLTALMDELLLPLHLVNIQYCDLRRDFDAGAACLAEALGAIASAEESPLAYADDMVAAKPSQANFFPFMAQLPRGDVASLVAQDLFRWALEIADEVAFGGKVKPGFHARIHIAGAWLTVFSVWAYPKTPALQLPLKRLAGHAPYRRRRSRRAIIKRLNRALPPKARLKAAKADRVPTLPLHLLDSAERLEAVKQVINDIVRELRDGESS